MTAVSTACRPAPAELELLRRSVALSKLLTTLLGMHTIARRHCEAARRQQARVTAGGQSFDCTRAGAEKFGPNQPPHRLHAPARSPQAQGGARRRPRWRSSFRCRSAGRGVPPHTVQYAKNAKVWHLQIRTYVSGVKKSYLSIRPN
jgi:hypothetical protein